MEPILLGRLTREFASAKTNTTEKYGEDLEGENEVAPGKRKLDKEEIMALTKHAWLYSDLLRAFKEKYLSALGF